MRHAISYSARTWTQWPSLQAGSKEIVKRIKWAQTPKPKTRRCT